MTFLLVDDDPYQRSLMEFEFYRLQMRLCVVEDGVEAQRYIAGEGNYRDRHSHPFPDVILLDLRMPRLDGFGFLAWLRSHPDTTVRFAPVVVMGDSSRPETIARAYELGANAYIVKAFGMEEFRAQVKGLTSFWGTQARIWRNHVRTIA